MKPIFTLLLLALSLGSCSGVQVMDSTYSAHAESLSFLGLEFPGDDYAMAEALVPEGASIVTVYSSPDDWTSFWGVVNNLFGFQYTVIGGNLNE